MYGYLASLNCAFTVLIVYQTLLPTTVPKLQSSIGLHNMLTPLITFSLVPSGFASLYKRVTSLSVSLSGLATNVTSIDDLRFAATVSNTGSEPARILKYGTMLDDILPSRSFTVTKGGEFVPFTGIKVGHLW